MQTEMNKLFAEGGVMQEGGTVDPVSGNDVPPGAMAEEVRDDIPAQLSEGEFVFPADVVRFYGLEKLMMMRDKAKKGLQRMNEIGQMGNAEEVEDAESLFGGEGMDDDAFSSEIDSIMAEDSGGETRGYAKGGDVRKYAPGGYVGGEENAQLYRDAPIKGFEMVPMTNDAGQTIYIPFINGVAQLSIPSGYKVKTAGAVETPVAEKPTEAAPTTGGDGGDGGDSGGGGGNTDGTTPGVQGSFSPVTGQQVGIVTSVLGMMGFPGMTIANLGKSSIAEAINTMGYNSVVSNNMSVVGEMMGLDPNDPANTAAISAAIDSTPNMGEQTSAPTATVGSTGTGGAAAAAAAAAASAAAAAGMSAAAQGAASQAAASATVGGASAGEAAAAGANAAAAADQGNVAEGGAMAAEASNTSTSSVGDASDPDGTVGGGGESEGSVGGGCVDPAVLIMLGDRTYVPAGTIKVGDVLFAMHEKTQEFGLYPVEHSEEVQQPKAIVKFSDGSTMTTSHSHKFFMVDGSWKQVYELEQSDVVKASPGETDKVVSDIEAIDDGPVMKITVKDAHTYISEGLISHNMKANGGIIKRKHMVAPTTKGPDDGYVALKVGEFVIKEKTTRSLGERKLKALNEGRADIVMRKGKKGLASRK